jgi:hypothetical protein
VARSWPGAEAWGRGTQTQADRNETNGGQDEDGPGKGKGKALRTRDLHKSRSLGGLCVARWSFRKFIFMQMQFDLFTEI